MIEGIFIAVALALLDFIRRAWRPYDAVLGRVDGLKGYHDVTRHPDAERIPGLVLFRWDAPLFFANAEVFADRVRQAIGVVADAGRWVVVAAEPVTDLDTTAADVLRELDEELAAEGVDLRFAEMKGPVKDRLQALRALRAVRRRPLLPHDRGRGERLPRDDGGRVDRLGGSPGTHAPRTRVRSAQGHPLGGVRWRGVRQAHHAERVEQPDEAGEDRDEQRHLKGERSRLGVDADDLVLDRPRVGRRAARSSWVLLITCASSSSALRDLLLARPAGARCSPRPCR